MDKTSIKEIPPEFVINNLTKYQKEYFELRYYIFNRFTVLRNKKMAKIDIYYQIAEEVGSQPDTVSKIYNQMVKRLITGIGE